ncbi:Dyp-type peroxidase [Mesorhizobium sp.]|uniref:Dyp-type peroxidase n=1 Tax=Mesorhizobium sp. TaxID=1871066 RepID=UPI0025E0CA66|nr:Dyp-type peroxidase [Mesorhizobium sp.]
MVGLDNTSIGGLRAFFDAIPYGTALDQYNAGRDHVNRVGGERLFCSVSLSATGLAKCGLPPTALPADISFRRGMKWASQKLLGDRAVKDWDPPFQQDVDILIVFASDDIDQVNHAVQQAADALMRAGEGSYITTIPGQNIKQGDQRGKEHFGFVDGVSQPLFFRADIDQYITANPVIVHDPSFDPRDIVLSTFPRGSHDFGSYLVFRQIEQNVVSFSQRVGTIARRLGADEEYVAAQVIGRYRDGSPLANSGISGSGPENNYNYSDDAFGVKCPYHGHVRKMNNRSNSGDDSFRVIARRGIPYEIEKDGSTHRGLIFMCYQNDIGRQFEFLQTKWANEVDFPLNTLAGIDPVIGQSKQSPTPQKWIGDWGTGTRGLQYYFSETTVLRGGEYFFTPPPAYLDQLRRG